MIHTLRALAPDRNGAERLDGLGLTGADVAAALLVLRAMRGGDPLSVRTAADLFNTMPETIRSTVRAFSARLYLAGPDEAPGTQFIEIAGEPVHDPPADTRPPLADWHETAEPRDFSDQDDIGF